MIVLQFGCFAAIANFSGIAAGGAGAVFFSVSVK